VSNNKLILSVQDLRVNFRGDDRVARILDGVSYDVHEGETVCLVGESGCGKTVSALTILGLIPRPPGEIESGRVLFQNQNLLDLEEEELQHVRGNRIAMVFQEPMTSLNPVFTIGDQIGEAILVHEDLDEKALQERCVGLLQDVGIPSPEERLKDYPHQLSGGQRQRVMIAMALGCNPDVVIADEPTTALDVTIQAQILHLFGELKAKRRLSLLYITHDLGVVSNIADTIYVMYAGVIAEEGNSDQIFNEAAHPYTQGLLASLPNRGAGRTRLHSIPGTVPDPAFKPEGCLFHTRCSYAVDSCEKEFPAICDYGEGHRARCPVLYERTRKKVKGERSKE
jgi:peptide/nickel transport system ATP-binding protein/oligopeptide transport system ATP-binding protein